MRCWLVLRCLLVERQSWKCHVWWWSEEWYVKVNSHEKVRQMVKARVRVVVGWGSGPLICSKSEVAVKISQISPTTLQTMSSESMNNQLNILERYSCFHFLLQHFHLSFPCEYILNLCQFLYMIIYLVIKKQRGPQLYIFFDVQYTTWSKCIQEFNEKSTCWNRHTYNITCNNLTWKNILVVL